MANYLGNVNLKQEKTPSIEQKIANIMGTTPSQVRALSDELTARRKTAEEAAKKAAEDQAARAKTEAALAAQRSAAAAKQSEAARVANAKAIKQRLSAGLKKPAQTSAVASAPATMVAIDTDILPAGTDTRSAIRSGKAYYDQLVEEGTQRADRSGVENALNGLEYETEKAKAQVETAAAAYNKTADYLKQQAAKIDELSAQIEVYSSNAEGMNAADRTAYNELVRQRDVAIDLYNRAAGQGQKWASTYETAAQNLSDASTAQGRVKYSNDAGAHLEGEITMAQGEYERVREYIRTNGAYIVQEYALRGEDGNAYMEDLLARSEQAVNDAKTAYAAWQSGKLAFEADIMEYDLPAADRMYFRRIAEYETYRGNFAKVGDSGYARAQEAAKRAEPILREKYGEKYSYYLQLTQYKINAEDREKQVNKIRSASGLEKGALSVLSVATNLLASPGVLYEYTVQSATRAADWMPIDTNAQGFSAQNLTQDIRGVTAQALENQYGKAASFVYSTAMSGLDSFVAGNTFGKAGGVVLGFSAGAAQMMDVTARGGSIEEAVASGIAAGVFEMLFETVSIGQMKAMQATAFQAGSLREMFSTKTLGTYVMNIGKEALVNFSEEAATEIANIMYDLTSLGDLSNIARQISTLMENEGLTEEQAKKIVAKTLGQQVLEAGLSGALMGAAFGAIDTSIAAYNQIENIKQLASARKLAATLPEAYRPSFDAANVTNETAAAYAVEVYLAAQRYNKAQQETQGSAKTQQEAESTAQAQQVMEEKAAVSVTTLASAQQVYEAQQEAHAQAQAETGAAQDATAIFEQGNTEAAVPGEAGNINGSETEADVQARGEVAQLAQAFAGEQLIQAVGDLANDRRMAGDAQGAAALEKALADYQAGVYTGENEGGTADGREVYLRDGGEWNDGTDSGGTIRSVAESTGRDPGGDLPGNGGRPAGAGGDAPGNQGAYRTVQGSTRQVTGFGNGEVSDSVGLFEELPPELEDLRQQVVKNGYSIRFTDGVMQFRTKRGTATVDGVYANGGIVVNARSAKWAPEQLVNHEMFHGFARENDGLVDAMVAKVFGDLTDAQIEEIVAKYQEAYKGAGLSRQQALEEICADAFAGMDRKNIGLAGRMSAAREFVGQQTGAQAATGMDIQGQTRAGRDNRTSTQTGKAAGSDAGGFVRGEAGTLYSIANTRKMQWRKQVDGYFRKDGSVKSSDSLYLGESQIKGVENSPLYIPTGVINKAVRKAKGSRSGHELSEMDIMRLENGIKTAPAVIHNPKRNAIVYITENQDEKGNYIIASFDLNNNLYGENAHKATSIHGQVSISALLENLGRDATVFVHNEKRLNQMLPGNQILKSLELLAKVESVDTVSEYESTVNTEAENFSIAGVRAKTADRAALEDAREMEKQGMDAAEIFRETGWYMGRDGKWRFELDDSAMRYSRMGDAQFRRNHPEYAQYQGLLEKVFTGEELTAQEEGRLQSLDETWGREGGRLSERVARGNAYLEDILDHPVLFEAYPQLRETRIRFSELGDGENGNYDRKTNTITLSEKLRSAPEDTLVHEIQHAIQQAEGFAGGASPEYWASRKGFDNAPERAYLQKFKSLTHEQQNQWTRYQELDRVLGELFLQDGKEAEYDKYERQQDALYERLYPEQWFKDMLDAERNKNDTSGYYRELYMNTAGEIEARDVSRRRTWDAGRRRNTMPDLGGENTVFADGANRSGESDIRFSPAAGTDYDAQIREYDEKIESLELEAAGGDEAARGALITARLNRSALMQQREAAQAEQKPEAPTAMQKAARSQIAGLEKQITENKAKQKVEQSAYQEDGKAAHLEEAQRLKQLVTQQRAQIRQIKRDAGIQAEPGTESGRRVFRPTQTIRQTENRILDLFRIQAGSRAGMRGELHSILERILMDGYVGNSDVDRALRAMYEAGREVLPAADPVYEDIAKGLRGKKIYVSDEVRAEFGEDWNGVRQQLWGRGIYTSTDIHESGIDSVYAGLSGEYPGLFDEEETDMRGMLEEILEAAQLGRAVHLTLGEAAEARGLTSDEEFEALTGEVMRELSKFADTAGVESRMRERTAQEVERQRGQYAEARRKAAERRAVAEQMRRIRSSLGRLNKRARVNDQILSRTMSMQDEATQEIMRQAQAQISTVANRITGKKMQNLLELKRVYEEAQAENPNFLPNPATEKALERVGQVHLQDLSVDELHTLYEAVERITHDLKTQDELIGKVWDDQLDHAADGLEQEIEFSHGAKGEGKLAKLYNEESLSPSRALLRLVGYDRSGIMGKIVKEFEDGDIAAMEYAVGADKIFADFMKKNGDWLKTAAGKKAKVVEVEVPRILAWGEGDVPIYDENGPKTIKIKLTQMMLVQMALDSRNEDNLRHIQYGGYSLPDIDRLKAGKTGSAYAKGEHVRGVKLAPEVLRRIVEENLDAQGKEYALLLHRYYNQFSKDRINRTSRMLDGVDKAMTRDYYPMQSDQGYLPKQYNVFDGTLEGMGSLKERQSGARNAIILGEADATMRWHRDNMARYVGYAVAKRNFEKLLNYRSSRGITIRESIKEKWGVNADAFLSDFMRTVEEGSLENVPDILSSITGNYVGSVLGFNVASMMKQLGAIPMAATKLGTGAMAVGLFQKGKSRDFILKYTPYLESRGKGYTYTEIADYSRKHEGQPSNRFMQTITGQNWLSAMDTAVNKAMWGAAEWYVSHHTNLRPGKQEDIDAGTDLFYQKVAEVFDRATHDTQTNYNLMSRPFALQRKGLRPFVMFRTDAYQAVGMIREAVGAWDTQVKHLKAADGLATKESVNKAGKLAVRAVLGVVSSNVLSAGIDLVRALLRGNDEEYEDEEGKLDLFRMGKDVARNTLINMLGGVVFVDTVAEFIDSQLGGDYFFAPELMGVASAEDFAGSIAEFVKTVGKSIGDLNALTKADGDTGAYLERQAEELAGAARDIALAVSQIFGLSLKNMERAVTTGLGLIYPGAKVAYNAVFSDVAKADLAGLEGDALVQGMTEYMRDELLFADEKVRDELVRLYGIYGAQILPGANAPTTRKLDDETERDLTVAEMGEWDAEYLRTMQKQLPEMISSTYYKSLSDDEKKAVLTSLNRFVAGAARKRIGMEPDAWVANVLEAGENGAEISDTVVYRALANMLEADQDEEGKAVSGSVLKKKIDLLDGMALTDREREAILGAFEQSEGGKYALAVKNGLKWDEYAEMVTEGWGSAENYNKLIDDGVAHDTALDLLEVKAGLEPEEGKTSVTNAQIYEAIAAADMTEAERYDAIGAVLGLDSKGYDKMRVVQDTGLRAEDYAALRGAEQEDQYLDAVELGMAANTAYAVVSAVAALPKLPEGERYTDAQRQAAACGACKSTAEQIDAYILYGNATYKTAEKAKLAVAAENYGVTPQMVLEFKELLAQHDANGNGSYDKAEKKAALEASGFTREQKRALWQLHDPDSKSNPFGGAWDIRDAYEEAKEKEKAEKKN